jgi:hypothetical protein
MRIVPINFNEVKMAFSSNDYLKLLEQLDSSNIDAVLLDGKIAEDRGAMNVSRIKQLNKEIKILVVANNDNPRNMFWNGKATKYNMTKISQKIKEAVGAADNLRKFKKFSKLKASYVEYDRFSDSNLREGYFCYNCIYWTNTSGGKCKLVENDGSDVLGNVSDVIAPHGATFG